MFNCMFSEEVWDKKWRCRCWNLEQKADWWCLQFIWVKQHLRRQRMVALLGHDLSFLFAHVVVTNPQDVIQEKESCTINPAKFVVQNTIWWHYHTLTENHVLQSATYLPTRWMAMKEHFWKKHGNWCRGLL